MLLHMVKSMVAQSNPPISYWGDALLITSHVLNQVPLKFFLTTPYELWNNRKPHPSNLRPWRLMTYVHSPSHKYGKLGHRGRKCIFIRYSEHSKECVHRWAWRWNSNWIRITRCHILRGWFPMYGWNW